MKILKDMTDPELRELMNSCAKAMGYDRKL